MSDKKKNIIIIALSVLLIIAIIIIIILFNNKKDVLKEVNGTVIVAGSDYVIIKGDKEDYLVPNINSNYVVGDEVEFTYLESETTTDGDLKSIKAKSEKTIRSFATNNKEETEDIVENEKEEITSNNSEISNGSNNVNNKESTTTKPNNNQITTNNTNNITNNDSNYKDNENNEIELTSADESVLTYLNNLKEDFDSGKITENLKSGFIKVVDFLFYNGKIKNHTFSELSSNAKLKALSLALYFDEKIENYFPEYKENISSTTSKVYTGVKAKVVQKYLEITTKICTENSELCETAKSNFSELKENFGLTWSLIKDIASDGLDNLKNWYEIWSGK